MNKQWGELIVIYSFITFIYTDKILALKSVSLHSLPVLAFQLQNVDQSYEHVMDRNMQELMGKIKHYLLGSGKHGARDSQQRN